MLVGYRGQLRVLERLHYHGVEGLACLARHGAQIGIEGRRYLTYRVLESRQAYRISRICLRANLVHFCPERHGKPPGGHLTQGRRLVGVPERDRVGDAHAGERLLADPLGLNLRNSISHGMHGTVRPLDASLLIQAVLFLAGLSLDESGESPAPPPGAGAA